MTPTRDDLVQEVERLPDCPPGALTCRDIPDDDCAKRPNCEGCPAKAPARLGRRA